MKNDRDEADRQILECVRWCDEHHATVRWEGGGTRCVVEVLAPGTSWNLLRGMGVTLVTACTEARARQEAWAREAPRRPLATPASATGAGGGADVRRWSA